MAEKMVTVLLSTYNGERYLTALLDSVLAQNGVTVRMVVRDDGSTDSTRAILLDYARRGLIEILEMGSNIGYARSFWKLLCGAEGTQYYAFADQDDIWLPNKLSSAIDIMGSSDEPLLCTSSVIPVDADLRELDGDPFPVHGPLSFAESLQRSILPGCTFVFNEAARSVASKFTGYFESHDWALYSIVAAFGRVFFNDSPCVLYRLHGENTIGAQSRLGALVAKIKRLAGKKVRSRSRFSESFLDAYRDDLDDEKLLTAALLADYRSSFLAKFKLLASKQFSGLIFRFYVLIGRV